MKLTAAVTATVIFEGIPKVIELTPELAEQIKQLHTDSTIYGVGGSTIKKFRNMAKKELASYEEQLSADRTPKEKFAALCSIFKLDSQNNKYLVDAIWHICNGSFSSSKDISLESMCNLLHLDNSSAGYQELENEFSNWCWHNYFRDANLKIGFIRFCKILQAIA